MTIDFTPPRRRVERVFIHCSATDDEALRGDALRTAVEGWHVARGFAGIGYHFLIDKEGSLLRGRGLERIPAAQAGHNARTIAIMVHGLTAFTPASLETLVALCRAIDEAYGGRVTFHGHREVEPRKTCPVFDHRAVLGLDAQGRMDR